MQEPLDVVLVKQKSQNPRPGGRHGHKAVGKDLFRVAAVIGPLVRDVMLQEFMHMHHTGDRTGYQPILIKAVVGQRIEILAVPDQRAHDVGGGPVSIHGILGWLVRDVEIRLLADALRLQFL